MPLRLPVGDSKWAANYTGLQLRREKTRVEGKIGSCHFEAMGSNGGF